MNTNFIFPLICTIITVFYGYVFLLDLKKSRKSLEKFQKILQENQYKIYGLEKYLKDEGSQVVQLEFAEFIKMQSSVTELLVNLDVDERKEILSHLNQSNLKGQAGYLSKLFQLSGFNKVLRVV
jgi:NADH:ubiquinone oxidoreductase subunit 5 (subunit L)/multisubunit Na+/H+ antiporter MnhA subunit